MLSPHLYGRGRSTLTVSSRVGNKLPLSMYADVRHSNDSSHSLRYAPEYNTVIDNRKPALVKETFRLVNIIYIYIYILNRVLTTPWSIQMYIYRQTLLRHSKLRDPSLWGALLASSRWRESSYICHVYGIIARSFNCMLYCIVLFLQAYTIRAPTSALDLCWYWKPRRPRKAGSLPGTGRIVRRRRRRRQSRA